MKPVPLPGPLRPGDVIGVVAPAGPATAEQLARVAPWLQAQGFEPRLYPGCHQRTGYLAGPDAQRLADLHAAFADPGVHGVVCLRGGYGSARLLDRLDLDLIARHPKPFVGYSDITALHAVFTQRCGFAGWHAPMLTSDLVRDDGAVSVPAWREALLGAWPAGRVLPTAGAALRTAVPGVARGALVGGNLAIVASLAGTPWALDTRGAVLFLEDVGEDLYRLDRLLTQLRLAGALQAAAGFVLGSFTDRPDAATEGGDDTALAALLDAFLQPLGRPVLAGWPSGHGHPHVPLPLGVDVVLDASAQTLALA